MSASDRAGEFGAVKVEWAMQSHVDHAGDAAFDIVGACRFINVDTCQKFGRNILQLDETSERGEDLSPVDQRLDVRQAADQQLVGFGGVAADLHAGDMLQGFDDVVVRQLADVFGDD